MLTLLMVFVLSGQDSKDRSELVCSGWIDCCPIPSHPWPRRQEEGCQLRAQCEEGRTLRRLHWFLPKARNRHDSGMGQVAYSWSPNGQDKVWLWHLEGRKEVWWIQIKCWARETWCEVRKTLQIDFKDGNRTTNGLPCYDSLNSLEQFHPNFRRIVFPKPMPSIIIESGTLLNHPYSISCRTGTQCCNRRLLATLYKCTYYRYSSRNDSCTWYQV